MKLFSFSLILCLVIFFSETSANFVNDVRDKFGNSDESNEKKSKKIDSKKGGYR